MIDGFCDRDKQLEVVEDDDECCVNASETSTTVDNKWVENSRFPNSV